MSNRSSLSVLRGECLSPIYLSHTFLKRRGGGGGGQGGDGLFKNTTLIYSLGTFEKNICISVPSYNPLLSSYKLN